MYKHSQEEVGHLRVELSVVARDILSVEHEDRDLRDHESNLNKALSDLRLQIMRLLSDWAASLSTKEAKIVIKLPKISVPAFDGNILHWTPFGSNLTCNSQQGATG